MTTKTISILSLLLLSSSAHAEGFTVLNTITGTPDGYISEKRVTYDHRNYVDSGLRYSDVPKSWRRGKYVVTPCGAVHIDFLDGRSVKQRGCPEDR